MTRPPPGTPSPRPPATEPAPAHQHGFAAPTRHRPTNTAPPRGLSLHGAPPAGPPSPSRRPGWRAVSGGSVCRILAQVARRFRGPVVPVISSPTPFPLQQLNSRFTRPQPRRPPSGRPRAAHRPRPPAHRRLRPGRPCLHTRTPPRRTRPLRPSSTHTPTSPPLKRHEQFTCSPYLTLWCARNRPLTLSARYPASGPCGENRFRIGGTQWCPHLRVPQGRNPKDPCPGSCPPPEGSGTGCSGTS